MEVVITLASEVLTSSRQIKGLLSVCVEGGGVSHSLLPRLALAFLTNCLKNGYQEKVSGRGFLVQ